MSGLVEVINKTNVMYNEAIKPDSNLLLLFNIKAAFEEFNVKDYDSKYDGQSMLVPLNQGLGGVIFEVEPYNQILKYFSQLKESGIIVSTWIAKESGLTYVEYKPQEKVKLFSYCGQYSSPSLSTK